MNRIGSELGRISDYVRFINQKRKLLINHSHTFAISSRIFKPAYTEETKKLKLSAPNSSWRQMN
jgi:hypothetical protein